MKGTIHWLKNIQVYRCQTLKWNMLLQRNETGSWEGCRLLVRLTDLGMCCHCKTNDKQIIIFHQFLVSARQTSAFPVAVKTQNPYVFSFAVYAASFFLFLLLILFLLLVFLWDNIVQEAEVMLGEHVVHRFSDSYQSEDLKAAEQED